MSLLKWFTGTWPLMLKRTHRRLLTARLHELNAVRSLLSLREDEIVSLNRHEEQLISANARISHERDVLRLSKELNGFLLVHSESPVFYVKDTYTESSFESPIRLQEIHCCVLLTGHNIPREKLVDWLDGHFRDSLIKYVMDHEII